MAGRVVVAILLLASLGANVALWRVAQGVYAREKRAAVADPRGRFVEANRKLAPRGEQLRVVAFGDSRIAQWPEPEFADLQWVNRGVGGETTTQLDLRFADDVLDLRPDVVVIQAGINDLVAASWSPAGRGERIESAAADRIAAWVAKLQAQDVRVVLFSIGPPASPSLARRMFWRDGVAAYADASNQSLAGLADTPGVDWIDTGSVLRDADGRFHPGVARDALHWTPEGYARLNAALASALGLP